MKRIARDVALFLAGLLTAIAICSLAQEKLEIQVELGQCRFRAEANGVFWQSGRYTQNYLTPTCGSIGVAGRLPSFWGSSAGWGWRVAFLTAGEVEDRGNVNTFRDDEAGHPMSMMQCHGTANGADGHGCMTVHTGSGNLRGFSAALTRRLPIGGGWSLGGEAGLLFHRLSYANHATWNGPCSCAPPGDYAVSNRGDIVTALPSFLAGVTLGWRQVYLFARHYESLGHRALSLTNGTFNQVGVGVAIPFGGPKET